MDFGSYCLTRVFIDFESFLCFPSLESGKLFLGVPEKLPKRSLAF